MGILLEQTKTSIRITKVKQGTALQALQALIADMEDPYWIEPEIIAGSTTLKEALDECRWFAEVCPLSGDIISLNFGGQKLGEEYEIFKALAPFIEDGSYLGIRWEGNYGQWVSGQYRFEHGKLEVIQYQSQAQERTFMDQIAVVNDGVDNKEVIETIQEIANTNPEVALMEGPESAPTLGVTEEESKPLTPEQIAYHQKQLRIKALKLAKAHKDAQIRHAKDKVAKIARRKNRTA